MRRSRFVFRRVPVAVVVLSSAAAFATPAFGWHARGHRRIAVEAVERLPASAPLFLREGAAAAADASLDPDLWRNSGTPELREREAPEHFIDFELLGGKALPENRSSYLALLARLDLPPDKVGFLPYAIVEGAERLALCLVEHRRRPEDVALQTKCLVEAGWLAHYVGDLEQPLHTTVDHDGRARPDGSSPRTGIHAKTDELLESKPRELQSAESAAPPAPPPIPISDLWTAVSEELGKSRTRIDAVYALEPKLAPRDGKVDPAVETFARERERAAVDFLSRVLLWSWERSAALELPKWWNR